MPDPNLEALIPVPESEIPAMRGKSFPRIFFRTQLSGRTAGRPES